MRPTLSFGLTAICVLLVACPASTPPPEAPPTAPAADANTPAPAAMPPEPAPAQRTWTLGVVAAESRVLWTAKKDEGAEVKGAISVTDGGVALTATDLAATRGALKVDFSTVASGNPARDGNIMQLLFEAGSAAAGSAKVEVEEVVVTPNVLDVGGTAEGTARVAIMLMQGKAKATAKVKVTRTDADHWQVRSTEPVALSLDAMGLGLNVPKLKEACGHKNLDDQVLVELELLFGPKTEGVGESKTALEGRDAPPGPPVAGGKP